jgi:hypothetical protein
LRIRLSPAIPPLHSLLQNREMFRVGH